MIRKLTPFLSKYKLAAILAPLMMVGEVFAEVRIPLLMATIVDEYIPVGDTQKVMETGLLMIGMALMSLCFGAMGSYFSSKAAMGFGAELRSAMFSKIQGFSFANVDKFSTASLVTRMTTDVTRIQTAVVMILRVCVRAPVMFVSALTMAYAVNKSLITVLVFAIPVLAIGIAIFMSMAYPRFIVMFKKYDKLNAVVQENLIAIRAVKAYVREKFEKSKFAKVNDELMEFSIKAEKVMIFGDPLMMIVMFSCIISVLWLGGRQIVFGQMEVGALTSFLTYITQILMSLLMVSMVFVMLVMSKASAARIVEVLEEESSLKDGEKMLSEVKDGSIEFKNVSFRYNADSERDVLENINLEIKSGETIGIIGGTGSSKSTLVQLIPRLYDVTAGQVFVGGEDVKDYSLEALRNSVAMVLQKNVLFSGTIRDNLRWGDENATDEEIEAACKAAQAHEFITSFPDGYDTDLGQGGVNVSGGQKQRLCIARALLKKPKIIILDDSTSAVDTATDAKIRQAFRDNFGHITAIIIAQRVTSIMDADRIIVLEDGKINGFGTHEALLKTNEIYSQIYYSQQKGVEE